jgi:toxin ParE1/3/4
MPGLVLAPEARQDLREIHTHIARDNPTAVRRVVTRLRRVVRMLAGAPAMGRLRPELGAHIRSFVADRYVLFYRPLRRLKVIEIVRVLHGARDVDGIFAPDTD